MKLFWRTSSASISSVLVNTIGPISRYLLQRIFHAQRGAKYRDGGPDEEADRGSLHVGSPETVAAKIAATAKALGIARFDLKYSAGALPHERLMRSIELYGGKVIPLVREMLQGASALSRIGAVAPQM
jgi:alkanesulfonate monooxygenase SsuD/methylene tetrahydromethanopterin reductase-like flavin-dependent oxidoreductase (luciferase family)